MSHEFMGSRAEPDIWRSLVIEIGPRYDPKSGKPSYPPTLNDHRHWRTIARDNATWKAHALSAAGVALREWRNDHGLEWRPLGKVALSVTFVVPTRARHDVDNLISTLKPLLDGVVEAGVIEDDSFEVIAHFDVACRYERGSRATILSISEILEDDPVPVT